MTAVKFDVVRSIGFASIGVSYVSVGGILSNNWRILKITSTLDNDVFVSLNGVDNNIFVPGGGYVVYDFGTNEPAIASNDNMVISKGSQFYVIAVGSLTYGDLHIEGVYS